MSLCICSQEQQVTFVLWVCTCIYVEGVSSSEHFAESLFCMRLRMCRRIRIHAITYLHRQIVLQTTICTLPRNNIEGVSVQLGRVLHSQ